MEVDLIIGVDCNVLVHVQYLWFACYLCLVGFRGLILLLLTERDEYAFL